MNAIINNLRDIYENTLHFYLKMLIRYFRTFFPPAKLALTCNIIGPLPVNFLIIGSL